MMLVDKEEGSTLTRFLHEQLRDASIRFADTPVLGESATWLRSIPGRRPSEADQEVDQTVLISSAPENALPDLAVSFRPDIVVGSTIDRSAWRAIQETCETLHIPTALYLCGESALGHLMPRKGRPFRSDDLVLANSRSLVTSASAFRTKAHYVPSVVDVEAARVDSTRERILLVHPCRDHGIQMIDSLASNFRTIEFVLQESRSLDSKERAVVNSILSRHPNVSFRSRSGNPAEIFRDATIVLAPHRVDHRPRIIREALGNGIPIIASDLPGLVEAVGPGGIIASDENEWFDAINILWQDPVVYRSYQRAASDFANRDEIQPDHIARTFLTLVNKAIVDRRTKAVDIDLR